MPELCLVINLGSSSLKAALYAPEGNRGQRCYWKDGCSLEAGSSRPMHALEAKLDQWLAPALEPHRSAIRGIGHRVVHGGERFTAPTRLTPEVEEELQALIPLAPLHNPPALRGMAWAKRWDPSLPQWACFDTAFHHTLPAAARTYALPRELRDQGFRRFGFHGLNHQHISQVVAHQWTRQGRDPRKLRLISAHLGAGASLSAVKGGVCIDTTMGYTPMEGLVMASRCGSLDPGVLLELMRRGLQHDQLQDLLGQEAGLKGLSNLSSDMRVLREQAQEGHQGAQLAIAVFRHRLLQLIGSMAASLQGVDVLALSGGIGEHDQVLLAELRSALAWYPELTLTVVPADEEGLIARLVAEQMLSPDQADQGSGAANDSDAGDRH